MLEKCHIFTVLLLTAITFQESAYAGNVNTYRDDNIGFEISYPDGWIKTQQSGSSGFYIKKSSPSTPGTISVDVKNFTGDKTLFMKNIKSNPSQFENKYKSRFPDAEILEHGETFLGGFPAYFFTITYSLKNLNSDIGVVAIQILCIKNQKIYLVNFESMLVNFEQVFNEFQLIISTFNFRR